MFLLNFIYNIRIIKVTIVHDFKRYFCSLTPQQYWPVRFLFSRSDLWDGTVKLDDPIFKGETSSIGNANIMYFWTTGTSNRIVAHYPVIYFYSFLMYYYHLLMIGRKLLIVAVFNFNKIKGETGSILLSLFVVTYIDALITDDEPLNDPVEWSLIQSWVMFIFGLAWVAENLISSRYGSYTGRDKRVWFAWYKTFWLIEGWYVLSLGAAALFVITPFYNELSYNLTMVVGWWNWYTRTFFFTFISAYTLILLISYYVQLNLRYLRWRKVLFYVALINIVLGYLLYSQFLISFFSYQTDPNWYHKSRLVDYVQLSHEPNKWAWGNSKRDHFSYHRSTTVFWFKTDLPMAAALMLFNILFFVCLFFLYIYWVVLFRRIYTTKEVTYTYFTYCVSSLRQFLYFFLFLYILVYFTFLISYLRLPVELAWTLNFDSWLVTFSLNVLDYPNFLLSLVL